MPFPFQLLELSELLRMEEHMDDFSRTHLQ